MTASSRDGSALRDYVTARNEVADLVRATLDALPATGSDDLVTANDLIVKLAEDRFNLVVVGQFKRGKSTLMNALIGRDLLPTGVLPLTSAITALCYGPREGVWLRRRDSVFEQEITTDELEAYVTERGNPGNEKGLIEARVELPLAFLRRGLYFVDSPGVGSASRENSATAYGFLPEADAVIFVTSVDSPLGEEEQQFLADIHEHVSRLIVVVNKIDTVTGHEREEVLAYIQEHIADTLAADDVPVFPVSARSALDAKLRGDDAGVRESGLREFELALSDFLANEQGRTFLVRILDRTIAIVAPLAESDSVAGDRRTLVSLLEGAVALRDRLLGAGPLATPESNEGAEADIAVVEAAVGSRRGDAVSPARRRRSTTGCPVCAAQSQAVFDFFAQWQHTLATDPHAQRGFAAVGGFCPAHTWQFQQIAAPQDLSAGYAPLVERVQREIARAVDESPGMAASRFRDWRQGSGKCAACRVLGETERTATVACLGQIESGGEFARAVLEAGWCLAHLQVAMATEPTPELARRLMASQAEQLQESLEEMRSYSLKRLALRRGIINTREAEAWRRALVQLVGAPSARGITLGRDDAAWVD